MSITISKDTWRDLHTNATTDFIRDDIKATLKNAVEAGIEVIMTDEEYNEIGRFSIEDDTLNPPA